MTTTSRAPLDPARWRRAGVLGLGLSGRAAARLLRSLGVDVVGTDRRSAEALDLGTLVDDPGVELRLGVDLAELPPELDALVVSPGVAPSHPLVVAARREGVAVVSEIDLAFARIDGPVVAITGSNGKSTTTAMTGALVAGAGRAVEVCGNIGRPLADVVAGPPGRTFVVELSSFQLESSERLHARAAALLNLSPDHLDRHGDLAGYLAAKRRIFTLQGPHDVAVLNGDEPDVAATPTRSRRRLFSRRREVEDGCWLAGDEVVERSPEAGPRTIFRAGDVPVPGPHNLENAMAAALLALALDVPAETIAPSLRGYRGLPHRLERVAEIGGVAYYDDSKGTNVAATERSIEGFADGSVHLILGGRNKGADLSLLAPVVGRKARRIYLIGESAEAFAAALPDVPASRSGTLAAAVADAASRAEAGESVVLSPACASFDQFRDLVERGETFQRLVGSLPGASTGAKGGGGGQEARV